MAGNSFGARSPLVVGGASYDIFRLDALEGFDVGRLPYSLKVLLENLLRHEDGQVTFATKNGNTATVAGVEFVRRSLQHVLPKRFVKIRHFGLHAAGNVNGKLARARELLPSPNSDTAPSAEPSQTFLDDLSEATPDLARCPRCGEGTLVRYRVDRRTGELVSVPEPET